jgi:thymidine phosphorylase
MLAAQGAVPGALDRMEPNATHADVPSPRSGFVESVDPVALGETARDLVARAGSQAGIRVAVRAGDMVRAGEALATVYGPREFTAAVSAAFVLADAPPSPRPLVYCEIGSVRETGAVTPGVLRSTLDTR